jgi:hypothetical protein
MRSSLDPVPGVGRARRGVEAIADRGETLELRDTGRKNQRQCNGITAADADGATSAARSHGEAVVSHHRQRGRSSWNEVYRLSDNFDRKGGRRPQVLLPGRPKGRLRGVTGDCQRATAQEISTAGDRAPWDDQPFYTLTV